jgi:hypothetical protein
MAADAEDASLSIPGMQEARVTLAEHFAGEEITAGVAERRGFQATLPGPRGEQIPPALAAAHLRWARAVRVSIEGNASFCRDLLSTRYRDPVPEEAKR